eukprot:981478-Pyramimonas_sp.AAC.1
MAENDGTIYAGEGEQRVPLTRQEPEEAETGANAAGEAEGDLRYSEEEEDQRGGDATGDEHGAHAAGAVPAE